MISTQRKKKLVGYRLNGYYFKEMKSLTLPFYLRTSVLSEFFLQSVYSFSI